MRLSRVASVCVFGVMGLALATAARAETAPRGWQTDYEAARAAAQAQNKPLLVHFYADWCGPCRAMEGTVLHTSEVLGQLGTRVIAVKVNSDRRSDLVGRYGITALPTDVFVAPNGNILSRSVGSPGKQGYLARIAQVSAQFAPTARPQIAQARPKADPTTPAPTGLEGYSPVTLMAHKRWAKGRPEFAAEHEGFTYHMTTAAELRAFRADPDRYAPQLRGHDPYLLITRGDAIPGNIRFGAFFRDELFLLASAENRDRFKADPRRYAQTVPVAFER